MDARHLRQWAVFRWGDEVLSLVWLYNRTGDKDALHLARTLHQQGYDWKAHFTDFRFRRKVTRKESSLKTHVVKNAMALKTSAVWSLVSGNSSDREAIYRLLEVMDRYHLLPNGVHSGDEHYAGRNPSQGTELCAVVEAMFSLQNLIAIVGDPTFGDRLEKIAFNALPGTFTADMWAHQYDQQPNQVLCNIHPRDWSTNGPDSNLFGLEPHYGCCTANMHQSWPKFAANLWMATPDDGLAAVAYGPSEVTTLVGSGVRVRIVEDTEYPFRDTIQLKVSPETPVEFPLVLRIPQWAERTAIDVNGKPVGGIRAGAFYTLKRRWSRADVVDIRFPMAVRASEWYRKSVAIERGPIVFALKIGEDWRKIHDKAPAADWEVHPTTAWNYGLLIDEANPARSVEFTQKAVSDYPFSPSGAPLEVKVKGRRIPSWKMVNGSAAAPPISPVSSKEPLAALTLIPYGSAKLRITAFPQLNR
jgi:DUF1680 family protein